jgi:hypothetical protein
MTAAEVLERLEGSGLRLHVEGDALKVRGFRSVLDEESRTLIRVHKPALLDLLFDREERAALSGCPDDVEAALWVRAVENPKVQTVLTMFRAEVVSVRPTGRREKAA